MTLTREEMMAACWLCLACDKEADLATCSECGRAVCHECCDWACDDEDDDCGDWVCDECIGPTKDA
jgi:hypothetical protein